MSTSRGKRDPKLRFHKGCFGGSYALLTILTNNQSRIHKTTDISSTLILTVGLLESCSRSQPAADKSPSANSGVLQALNSAGPTAAMADVEIPRGSVITVRLDEALSSERNRAEDSFTGEFGSSSAPERQGDPSRRYQSHRTCHVDGAVEAIEWALGSLYYAGLFRAGRPHVFSKKIAGYSHHRCSHRRRHIEMVNAGAGVGSLIGSSGTDAEGAEGRGSDVGSPDRGAEGEASGPGESQRVEVPTGTVFQFNLKEPVSLQLPPNAT